MVLAVVLTFAVASRIQVAHEPAGAPAGAARPGGAAPHVVLISGEEEYDAEASLSALAHLLADRHGMTTMLASSHSAGTVAGLEPLASADLAILFVRSRTWPEAEWRRLEGFLARGGALVALRSSVGAFAWPAGSPLSSQDEEFGTRLFGTPWQWDHGPSSSTDVLITPRRRYRDDHELLCDVTPTFHVRSPLLHVLPLPEDVNVIARGKAVGSERADGGEDANPVAWTRVRADGGRTFYTSMGHPDDFEVPAFRRLLVNGIHWTLKRPTAGLDVTLPETKPLTQFEVSTSYLSDWSKPIEAQHFPPEEGIAGFNDVQWIKLATPDGTLDFRRFDPASRQGTIYAKTTIHAAGPRQLELVVQPDDAVELFVDRKSRFVRQEVRSLHAGCELVPLELADGDHELMFKVMNAKDAWGLRVRVRDLTAYREERGNGK